MKRRGGASGQRPKAARRSTAPKRRAARKPAGRRKPPESDLQSPLQDCTRELNAARDQLTAMSEVVSVISGSSGDLKPVFDVLLANAVRICGARFGNLSLVDGDGMRMVAMHNAPPEFEKLRRREPIIRLERSPLGALFQTKKIVHIGDLAADKAYANAGLVKVAGARAALCVPMLRDDDLIGALVLYRMEPLPFSDKQVELLTNFASQAVIAIENARLLNELRQSLQQQTATADVLKVISRSTFDLQVVLDTLTESAARLCRADQSAIRLVKDNLYNHVASDGSLHEHKERMEREPLKPGRGSIVGRVVLEGKTVHHIDALSDPNPEVANRSRSGNVRSVLGVPLLREGTPIGVLLLQRCIVQPFTDKEIALAETFADQAVIAIENVRLFEAEQQRAGELQEALAGQTATSEILRVISRSPTDVQPVFDSIVLTAVRLLRCDLVFVLLCDGATISPAAVASPEGPLADVGPTNLPIDPSANFPSRAILDKKMLHLPDWSLIELPEHERIIHNKFGVNSALYLPLLREGECIGLLTLVGKRPNSFGPSEIAQAESFRDQALIAIENSRLFNDVQKRTAELTESLEQQTATGEILSSISGSIADTKPVFDAIVRNLLRLFGTRFAAITLLQGGMIHMPAVAGEPGFERLTERYPRPLDDKSVGGQAMLLKETVQFAPVVENPAVSPFGQQAARDFGYNSLVFTPMMRGDKVIGALGTAHREPKPFSDKQIVLLRAFADQAVIAIENTRLLSELRERTTDLQQSLARQTATSEILRVISQSPTDVQPVFDSIVLTALRLLRCDLAVVHLCDNAIITHAAVASSEGLLTEAGLPNMPIDPSANFPSRAILDKKMLHLPDWSLVDLPEHERNIHQMVGVNSALYLPLLREGECIGLLTLVGKRPNSFGPSEIAQAESFRDQALIAIENTRLFNETKEALEQQTATSEVLQVISSSPGDLQPVFDTMLENAVRICDATFGNIYRWDGELLHLLAAHKTPPALAAARKHSSLRPTGTIGRMVATKTASHVADLAAHETYTEERDPGAVSAVELGGVRTVLAVPMLKENELIGSFTLYRQEVRPFTDKQIALVTSFANQAVIAIENTRLLTELRQRTDDLSESLEQQTATSEVLRVISSSPGDLQPVFAAMLENAVRISSAKFGIIHSWDGESLRLLATHNLPPALNEARRRAPQFRPGPKTGIRRMAATKSVIHIPDLAEDKGYLEERAPQVVAAVEQGGVRTMLAVPMLKENEVVGAFTVYRQEVRPFTDKQIALITSFAAQAVIAVENARLLTELRQSLEQQTATADVLSVISSSPGDLKPVFDAMLGNAARLCEAQFGNLLLCEGEAFRVGAMHNMPPLFAERFQREPVFHAGPLAPVSRATATGEFVHVVDLTEDAAYKQGDPPVVAVVDAGGARSMIVVPMLKESEAIGALSIFRREVRPFTDKQIDLVKNFAAQAVIAIENTRLLSELRESLAQQTATADVLRVISSSPGELEPVFQAMLENATRICEAKFGALLLCEGDVFRRVALHNAPPAYVEEQQRNPVIRPTAAGALSRLVATRQVIHIADWRAEQAYLDGVPTMVALADAAGARSVVVVPMLKDDVLVGAITIYRQEVRPFTDKQIELVQNFATQAVIAIENTRLLTELRQRTTDLTESLEQQTATSEVLRVISSSPGQLEPVFAAILDNATRICQANFGTLFLREGEALRVAAHHGSLTKAWDEQWRVGTLVRPDASLQAFQTLSARQPLQVVDLSRAPSYLARNPKAVNSVEVGGIRTMVTVPMLKDSEAIGVITIFRTEVREFTDKQIALVTSFAAQAVIAIENARLLTELRERTDELGRSVGELRALGEVSQAVNSTLDLETVLSTIVAKAVQLSSTEAGAIYVFDDLQREFHLRATYGMERDLIDALKKRYIGLDETNIAMAIGQHEPIQVADLREEAPNAINEIILRAGFRARLTAPLMRGEDIVGMLVVRRRTPGAFPQNTVDLIKTFAAQSVLAIQNARLFENVETRTGELARSLKDLQTAQDRLVQTEKLASLGQLTAGIAHEIKNPLNFVNNFSAVSVELIDELRDALGGVHLDSKLRAEIDEIADMLQGNLDKVVQHGKRADSIVKNMLLHSRAGSGEHRPVDINAIVEESLNLAYHGARAEKQGFNITLERSFDPAAGEVDLFPQEMTRVLLNLISNGFYAATKRKAEANGGNYEPTLSAATKNLGDSVEIRIRDNGTGIPPEVRDKMFNPFFTTKPAGEGTGLGLSLSHDIIVKQHSGSIEVDTKPGEFSEFRIVLPRGAATIAKPPESTSGENA